MSRVRIVVMAKAPLPGLAKTRLIPALGAEGAAKLARRMLQHALHEAQEARIGPLELCRTPHDDTSWQGVALPAALTITAQGEGDLGERMARVAARVIGAGQPLVLTGTDCPGLSASVLRQMSAALEETDAVIVPATDGGYVALGLRKYHEDLFAGVAWSTASVAAQQCARIAQQGWSLARLPPLNDIDEPADLQHLPAEWLDADA